MFRALDNNWEDVVSLTIEPAAVPDFHEKARRDELICPECQQPVWFKAGEFRQYHFAHKDKGKCPLEGESAAVLRARSALYRLLTSVFPEGVTLEAKLAPELPRAVDCVLTLGDVRIAYWIVEGRWNEREWVSGILRGNGIVPHWVFVAEDLRRHPENSRAVFLSPTQRDLREASAYDRLASKCRYVPNCATLHFLDGSKESLTTYRGLRCIHGVQTYEGACISSPLSEVTIAEDCGEFVHPGEWEQLDALYKREQAEQEARIRLEEENERRWREQEEQDQQRRKAIQPPQFSPPLANDHADAQSPWDLAELECMFCGKVTRDWWMKSPPKYCKCKECKTKGIT